MITTPTLLINEKICRQNISTMVEKAERNGVIFRPHFKTHQSHAVGKWFREAGVTKITASSLKMASYFSDDDWEDITVAFPVNILEINTINQLAGRIQLNLLFESEEVVNELNKILTSEVGAFLKIDVGTHRTGLAPDDHNRIMKILKALEDAENIRFCGFLAHAGHSYGSRDEDEIRQVHEQSMIIMQKLDNEFRDEYPGMTLSVGDTPTCSKMEDFSTVDELRPGNFAFYDIMQEQIGSCAHDQIAVAMTCPVVALHPEREEMVIYGGGVHFSKDFITVNGNRKYGQVVETMDSGWGDPVPRVFLKALSQEHGIISAPKEFIEKHHPGDLLTILPVHSCMTANLMGEYLTLDGGRIPMMR